MRQRATDMIKGIIPATARDLYWRLSGRAARQNDFIGDYASWEEARQASGGYDSDVILAKVRDALLKVRDGEAIYERDSVLFDSVQYSWPLLAALLWVASNNGNCLNLIDFGGSLGSTYYQNITFLRHLDVLRWSIVDQEQFVECGRRYFENDHLKFYCSIDECRADRNPPAILFSSVIQYLEKPYDLLADVVSKGFPYIIFDRTTLLAHGADRLTVQTVPPYIYPASYPAWFFNREKFLSVFADTYELMAGFNALGGSIDLDGAQARDEGFIFRLKTLSGRGGRQ